MNSIKEDIADMKRFDEIVKVLSEEGFHLVLDRLNLTHRLPVLRRLKPRKRRMPAPERLHETFERLGPTFIKFGQILAQRPDLVPQKYIDELEELEDSVPSFDPEKAREILEEEVGMENFSEFKEEPVAAASIAQVHEARLESGERVAVKVRRPGIVDQMEEDLDILEFLARRGEKHVEGLEKMNFTGMVEEFSSWTRDELDLKKEGRNAKILKNNLEDEERIKIPEVYPDLTTEKVLTMEYVEGVKSDNLDAIEDLGIEKEEFARTAIRAGLKQVIDDGFFHADPHPSNFLVNSDGKLVFLDFGMMGQLSKDTRKYLGLLIIHALNEDIDGAMDTIKAIGTVREDADLDGLKQEVEKRVMLLRNATLEQESLSKHLFDLTVIASEKGVVMPTSLVIMGKTLVTMEGIGLRVYPELDLREEFTPITREILEDEYSMDNMFDDLKIDLMENSEILTKLPSKLNNLAEEKQQDVTVVNGKNGQSGTVFSAGLVVAASILMYQTLPDHLAAAAASALVLFAALIYVRQ